MPYAKADISEPDDIAAMNANTRALLLLSQAALPLLRRSQLEARDVADAVLFLASPLSDLVQGHTLVIDGGASIHV